MTSLIPFEKISYYIHLWLFVPWKFINLLKKYNDLSNDFFFWSIDLSNDCLQILIYSLVYQKWNLKNAKRIASILEIYSLLILDLSNYKPPIFFTWILLFIWLPLLFLPPPPHPPKQSTTKTKQKNKQKIYILEIYLPTWIYPLFL